MPPHRFSVGKSTLPPGDATVMLVSDDDGPDSLESSTLVASVLPVTAGVDTLSTCGLPLSSGDSHTLCPPLAQTSPLWSAERSQCRRSSLRDVGHAVHTDEAPFEFRNITVTAAENAFSAMGLKDEEIPLPADVHRTLLINPRACPEFHRQYDSTQGVYASHEARRSQRVGSFLRGRCSLRNFVFSMTIQNPPHFDPPVPAEGPGTAAPGVRPDRVQAAPEAAVPVLDGTRWDGYEAIDSRAGGAEAMIFSILSIISAAVFCTRCRAWVIASSVASHNAR